MSNMEKSGVELDAGCQQPGGQITQIPVFQCNKLMENLQALKRSISGESSSPYQVVVELALQACKAYHASIEEKDWLTVQLQTAEQRSGTLVSQLSFLLEALNETENTGVANILSAGLENMPDHDESLANEAWQRFERLLHSSMGKADLPNRQSETNEIHEVALQNLDLNFSNTAVAGKEELHRNQNESQKQAPEGRNSSVNIRLLGGFDLYQQSDVPKKCTKGKAQQILKYLVVNRHMVVPKEVLMELFWPHHGISSARNNLNVAVYGLRKALSKLASGASYILFRDGGYQINPAIEVWIDYEEFESHIKRAKNLELRGAAEESIAEYRKAEALYRGDFLPEDLYEEWTSSMRQNLKDEYISVLKHLGDHSYDLRDYTASVGFYKKLVAIDACDEEAHQKIMSGFEALGQRHLALRQFNLARQALQSELGLEPDQATISLYNKIKNGDHDASAKWDAIGVL